MNLKFKDVEHEKSFNDFIHRARVSSGDIERICLFYLFALMKETRTHIDDLYDFKTGCMKPDGFNHGWQTSGSVRITKLGFNLFNNYRGEDREREDYSPLEIFCISEDYREYMLYAVQMRFQY